MRGRAGLAHMRMAMRFGMLSAIRDQGAVPVRRDGMLGRRNGGRIQIMPSAVEKAVWRDAVLIGETTISAPQRRELSTIVAHDCG